MKEEKKNVKDILGGLMFIISIVFFVFVIPLWFTDSVDYPDPPADAWEEKSDTIQ